MGAGCYGRALGRAFIAGGSQRRALELRRLDGFSAVTRGSVQGARGHGRGRLVGWLGTALYGGQSGLASNGRGGVGAVNREVTARRTATGWHSQGEAMGAGRALAMTRTACGGSVRKGRLQMEAWGGEGSDGFDAAF